MFKVSGTKQVSMVDAKCRQVIWVQSLVLLFHFSYDLGQLLNLFVPVSSLTKYHLPNRVAMRIKRLFCKVLGMMLGTCTW